MVSMKVAIISFSQLGACWSALRYTGNCKECQRVNICKLPEAAHARLAIEETKLEKLKEELAIKESAVNVLKTTLPAAEWIQS